MFISWIEKKGTIIHNKIHKSEGRFIKNIIYAGLDGTITTFAVIAGVTGASLNASIILILGFANLFADGISMAAGDYLSTRAKNDYTLSERDKKENKLKNNNKNKKNLIEVYKKKGFKLKDARLISSIISKYKKFNVDVLMTNQSGLEKTPESAILNSIVTLVSFVFFGFIPLLVYVVSSFSTNFINNTFIISLTSTFLNLILLGSLKTHITNKKWLRSVAEVIIVGGSAALIAYFIGFFLSGV